MVIITRELIILYEKLKVNEKRALRKKKIFLLFLYFCFITLDFNSIVVYNIYIEVYFFLKSETYPRKMRAFCGILIGERCVYENIHG